jgi:hypothetical protein
MRMRNITDSDVRSCLRDFHSRIVGRNGVVYLGDVAGRTLKVIIAADRDTEAEKFVITTVWKGDDEQ